MEQSHKEWFETNRDRIPVRQGQFLGEEKESFYVALSPEEIYELSPLVYYVWLLCDGKHSIGEIAEKMSSDLDISVEEAIDPLVAALHGLENVNLVVIEKKTPV